MSRLAAWRPAQVVWIGVLLFVLALILRLLFLHATADATGPFSPYYKGDTPVWLDYAGAIQSSTEFNLGLPMRPPGIAYWIALLWNGENSGLLFLKSIWALTGAATVALFFFAVRRSFDLSVAVVAALLAAGSTGLMVVSTSPNNETPYLFLLMASFALWESVRHRPRWHTLLAWSLLHGLACLIRVEHVLFFTLVSASLVVAWARCPGQAWAWKPSLGRLLVMLAMFTAPLIPWHAHIWSQIEQFNGQPLKMNSATEQAYRGLEQALAGLNWSSDAIGERESLPVFMQRTMAGFVAATVAIRGQADVRGENFTIIEEAFGSRPEPLAAYPFVALYGGLNFYLANNATATGGFSRGPLEAPPPLAGGPARYPGFLISGLPPPDLTLSYPPHLEIVNHGYRLGWNWMKDHPADFLGLALGKLHRFWAGATLGFTGYNLPLGMSGTRGVVDLVVPEENVGVALWRWGVLAILLLSLWAGRREPALVPWLLFAATKVITTVAFFGYAREGVVVIPVVALLLSLWATRTLPAYSRVPARLAAAVGVKGWLRVSAVAALMLVAVEGVRWFSHPVLTLDGQQVGVVEPFPAAEFKERQLQVQ